MARVISARIGVVHCQATCRNCDWEENDIDVRRVQRAAKRHVGRTGHTVHVETARVYEYRSAK